MPSFKKGAEWNGNAAQLWKKGQSGNVKGRGANKTITAWMKDLLASEEVEVSITRHYTSDQGKPKVKKENIKLSSNDNKTMNAVIAARLVQGAADNNLDYIREVLNRVEGRPKEVIEVEDSKPKEKPPQIIFSAPKTDEQSETHSQS